MRPLPHVAFSLLVACILPLAPTGCGDEATRPCAGNEDCRDGFQCGVGPFAGECIQVVSVITCGDQFCDRGKETCQNGACVAAIGSQPPAGDGALPPANDATAPPGGDAAPPPPDAGRPSPNEAGFEDSFVPPPDEPPVVTIATPFDGEVIVDRPAELSGQVFGLTAAGRVTFTLDDDPAPRPLLLEGDSYRAALELPPGRHSVVVTATNGGPEGSAAAGFRIDFRITTSRDRLMMNGQPWRFVGLATPDLRELAHQAALGGEDRVPEVLGEARRLGVRVLRLPACDDRPAASTAIQTAPGTFNEPGLVALDNTIARAGDAGLKLLLPLVDTSDALGGITQYLRWHGQGTSAADRRRFFEQGPVREAFKSYVRAILSRVNSANGLRYGEDPAILGWEIFTSGDALGVYDPASAGAEMEDFVADLTQVLRAGAPGTLVGTGEMGFDVNPSLYGQYVEPFREVGLGGLFDASHGLAWHRNLRTDAVTFAGLQLVPDRLGFSGDAILYSNLGAAWIRGHAALSATTGKPLVVTLAALNMAILSPEGRRQAIGAWLDEFAALGFAGFVVGNLHADGFDHRADPHGFAWAEGTDAADPQNELVPAVQSAAARIPQ